ncbi:hypothetical protein FPV67DRAFT_1446287 [Lyophyllum atratum]|nr:hypothetical protein FPV67DRAFT_1446287 [Lyophyllum atratum]
MILCPRHLYAPCEAITVNAPNIAETPRPKSKSKGGQIERGRREKGERKSQKKDPPSEALVIVAVPLGLTAVAEISLSHSRPSGVENFSDWGAGLGWDGSWGRSWVIRRDLFLTGVEIRVENFSDWGAGLGWDGSWGRSWGGGIGAGLGVDGWDGVRRVGLGIETWDCIRRAGLGVDGWHGVRRVGLGIESWDCIRRAGLGWMDGWRTWGGTWGGWMDGTLGWDRGWDCIVGGTWGGWMGWCT